MSLATSRLAEERKKWRKDHPFGFVAKPWSLPDGATDLLRWDCKIPGKKGTIWENGLYPVTLQFFNDYPVKAPVVSFPKGFKHPNVFDDGKVCLSLISVGWRASISVKEILIGLQDLLDTPNDTDPANWDIAHLHRKKRKEYEK